VTPARAGAALAESPPSPLSGECLPRTRFTITAAGRYGYRRIMKLSPAEARERFVASPVARLATAGADGAPHIVPITFAVDGEMLYSAVDHKPKTTWNLRRLRNIRENPGVAVLVDHYDADWSALWWARADGRAEIRESGTERSKAIGLLLDKYEQYRDRPPEGPVVAVRVNEWSGWAFTG
jgi:PPOX class probable F420-dependent enzyme